MLASDLSLERDGAELRAGLAVPLLPRLIELADRTPRDRAGTRIVGSEIAREVLSPEGPIGETIGLMTGPHFQPVRAILFDKNDEVNWALGWHQDRTVAVAQRIDTPGYAPWTNKQGIPHVQPPFDVIERMITVRIHLDRVDERNAPLRIALGSHRMGRIAVGRIGPSLDGCATFDCLADPGDVWIYSTPILHASDASEPGRRRRVLQADYSAEDLAGELQWLGI